MTGPVRVLVVDDSAFARKVVREVLERAPGVEVVGTARDGLDALDRIAELAPDVVTLDLSMPHLDGVGVLQALPSAPAPAPRVVVVSASAAESDLVLTALEAGAVDFVRKPTALATDRLYELARELVARVRAAAEARRPPAPGRPPPTAAGQSYRATRTRLLVVGTSTGGPQALMRLLASLPAELPVPVALALHIPAGYTDALARRLDQVSPLTVEEARDGLVLRPGRAALAQGGLHLRVARQGGELVARVGGGPHDALYRPSVDLLFSSAAEAVGGDVLGVVLTGMGDDGVAGAGAIRAAGGEVLAEAARTCVVYGMPRAVVEAGLSVGQAPLDDMGAAILARLTDAAGGPPQ